MIDLQAVTALVWGRLRSDQEGAAVRDALGAGQHSVIPASALSNGVPPQRPFVALREGPMPITDRIVHIPLFTWWLYDDPNENSYRINGLVTLIGLAYAERKLWLPTGACIGGVDIANVTEYRPDLALNLGCRSLTISIHAV